MSGWYYVAVKVKHDFLDEYEYVLGEAFPGLEEKGEVVAHTNEASLIGETPEDLAKWLRIAADDVEKYGCVNEEED